MLRRLSSAHVRTRFLVLVATRWVSTGLVIPVGVLLMLSRGLTIGEVGAVTAAQGVVAFVLELPTGGLADSWGRRRILLVASVFAVASYAVMVVATSMLAFAAAWALQGVFRALESGPLEAWYVDAAQAADPDCEIEVTMARRGVVIGLAIGTGTLISSGLVAIGSATPWNPLVVPILVAVVVCGVETVLIARLMRESDGFERRAFGPTLRLVPAVAAHALRAVKSRSTLVTLVTIEALWGFGMPTFELFTPAKLGQVLDSTAGAAQILGPTQTVGWVASAAGAALVPVVGARLGLGRAGALMLGCQAVFIVGIGSATGVVGVVVAFVLTMTTHGGANSVHAGLLHRAVDGPDLRASVVSVNSLCGLTGGTVGGIALAALADATTLTIATLVGAMVIGGAASLYIIGGHAVGESESVHSYSATDAH